ncbi:MAG: sugar transferase [Pseudomonadota bacterium]
MKDFEFDYAERIAAYNTQAIDWVGADGKRVRSTVWMGKRLFDIVLSLFAALVLVPLIAVLWVIVRADGGPGFYSQKRVGKNGRIFRCWKLRTMVVDAEARLQAMCEANPELAHEWYVNQKLRKDPRITRWGSFLRKTSLDELPQLWNIFVGDMSIVGPRPFIVDQAEIYNSAGGRAYYTVRPGITGPWQVFGRGQTTFADRVQFDAHYCRTQSLLTDLFYIWKTFGVVLRRTGA